MKIRRINFLGGPGCRKSALAASVYAYLKEKHQRVELVREHCKNWVYTGQKIESFDQWYLFMKQLHEEDKILRKNINIISDCPVILGACYAARNGLGGVNELIKLYNIYEKQYPSLNIFIRRSEEYIQDDRWETKEEAIATDKIIKDIVLSADLSMIEFNCYDKDKIFNYITHNLEENQ